MVYSIGMDLVAKTKKKNIAKTKKKKKHCEKFSKALTTFLHHLDKPLMCALLSGLYIGADHERGV